MSLTGKRLFVYLAPLPALCVFDAAFYISSVASVERTVCALNYVHISSFSLSFRFFHNRFQKYRRYTHRFLCEQRVVEEFLDHRLNRL